MQCINCIAQYMYCILQNMYCTIPCMYFTMQYMCYIAQYMYCIMQYMCCTVQCMCTQADTTKLEGMLTKSCLLVLLLRKETLNTDNLITYGLAAYSRRNSANCIENTHTVDHTQWVYWILSLCSLYYILQLHAGTHTANLLHQRSAPTSDGHAVNYRIC